jgi:gliding motility-associated-like protein
LANSFSHINGFTYAYFSDAAAKAQLSDTKIYTTGKYFIKVTNSSNCSILVAVNVEILPPPPYTITYANTFTPNGDGINDKFFLNLNGVSLNLLQIFNRYGQLVFSTRSINDYWTGNSGSSPIPTGTYYWIFDGTDDYYHTKVRKSSSITIIR